MRAWVFSIVFILLAPGVSAQAPLLPGRYALHAVLPAAVVVIEQIEDERGHRFTDDELPAVLNSANFERRLGEHIKADPAFVPCRIEQCLSA